MDSIDVLQFMLLPGLRYLTPFDFPLNFQLRAGVGLSYSLYSSSEVNRQTDLGGFTLADFDSIDFMLRFGGGIRIDFTPRFFIDLTLDVRSIVYYEQPAWFLQPRLEGGIRW